MIKKMAFLAALTLGIISAYSQAAPLTTSKTQSIAAASGNAPTRQVQLVFSTMAPQPTTLALRGIMPDSEIEFDVRRDEVVSKAVLNLQFTPSPSLIPVQSQLNVYLNDALIQTIPITKDQLGKPNSVQVPIEPRYISDFNKLRLHFIGHYTDICEDPARATLWLDINKFSSLDLTYQKLLVQNDLSNFPQPFFDTQDNGTLTLPMVFAGQPDLTQQRAAAILASWFGSKSGWHGQSFPTLFNQLPSQNAIIFATNQQRPDFLRDHPAVNAPTIEIMSHPNNPYVKLLLVLGRDDNDLITAVQGIAQGNILFRGQMVTVDKVEKLAPRQPYDAPNWVRIDRPTTFAELQQFNDQFQTSGFQPWPILLRFNLPPDMFLNYNSGIKVRLHYRYTAPPPVGFSRLTIFLNNNFIRAFLLDSNHDDSHLFESSVLPRLLEDNKTLNIPTAELSNHNQLRLTFDYARAIIGGTDKGQCETYVTGPNHAAIDGDSSLDFSQYRHFITMPNLSAFMNGGFPFSRLADLSQTLILISKNPPPVEITTLLNAMGRIGAETGYPALAVRLSDDWSQAKDNDVDILMVGSLPAELRDDKKMNLLLNAMQSWVKEPFRQDTLPELPMQADDAKPDSKTTVSSTGIISAIAGAQSPYYKQRSIVALLADSPQGFALLNDAMLDNDKRANIFGSVAVIRQSSVNSLRVGDIYHVGHIPWWSHIWYTLQNSPGMLVLMALFITLSVAYILWLGLKRLSRRRLWEDNDKD